MVVVQEQARRVVTRLTAMDIVGILPAAHTLLDGCGPLGDSPPFHTLNHEVRCKAKMNR